MARNTVDRPVIPVPAPRFINRPVALDHMDHGDVGNVEGLAFQTFEKAGDQTAEMDEARLVIESVGGHLLLYHARAGRSFK